MDVHELGRRSIGGQLALKLAHDMDVATDLGRNDEVAGRTMRRLIAIERTCLEEAKRQGEKQAQDSEKIRSWQCSCIWRRRRRAESDHARVD